MHQLERQGQSQGPRRPAADFGARGTDRRHSARQQPGQHSGLGACHQPVHQTVGRCRRGLCHVDHDRAGADLCRGHAQDLRHRQPGAQRAGRRPGNPRYRGRVRSGDRHGSVHRQADAQTVRLGHRRKQPRCCRHTRNCAARSICTTARARWSSMTATCSGGVLDLSEARGLRRHGPPHQGCVRSMPMPIPPTWSKKSCPQAIPACRCGRRTRTTSSAFSTQKSCCAP